MPEPIELMGTVKKMSPSGKGFVLNEYDDWFNFGKGYDGPRPFVAGAAITLTYEENVRADGSSSFFVLTAWPTTGQAGPVPQQVTPPGPKPTAGPTPTNGPKPAQPDSYEGYQAAATGPTPTPPNRDNYILFEVCIKEARDWVLQKEAEGSAQRNEGHWLFVTDLIYDNALKKLSGESEEPQDGDPGPEPAA